MKGKESGQSYERKGDKQKQRESFCFGAQTS